MDRRDLPAGLGMVAIVWGLYELYTSPPVAIARKFALGGKLGRLAWTGHAKFAFGLIRVSHRHPLGAKPHFRRLLRRPLRANAQSKPFSKRIQTASEDVVR